MDEMQITDLCIATKYLEYVDVSSWCQTRQLILASLKPYLKRKNITAAELWPLPIDDDYKQEQLEDEDRRTYITDEELDEWNKFVSEYNKEKKVS